MAEDNSISINKFISQTGICSRREADRWIEAGRISINNVVAQKGNRVFENDEVKVDNKPLINRPKTVYMALNKPPGITCTTDLKDKDNIIDFVQYPERIFPIGRLDKPSTGLILLTNDGDVVNRILRSENNHEKEYIVVVNKPITKRFIQEMSKGVPILETTTKPCIIEQLGHSTFRIILTQGLNRQIRRMCDYLEYQVVALKRIRIMNILLEDLEEGSWRYLTSEELAVLSKDLNYTF